MSSLPVPDQLFLTKSNHSDDLASDNDDGPLESLKDQLDGWRRQRAEKRLKKTGNSVSDDFIEERLRVVALDISDILRRRHMKNLPGVGNLSPSTIVFDANGRANLRQISQKKGVDFRYTAPEAMTAINDEVDEKCDVYSFAVVLWELATLEVPYQSILKKSLSLDDLDRSSANLRQQLSKQVGRKNVRPKLSKVPSRALRKLLENCWDPNPLARPPITRVWYTLHHSIFPPEQQQEASDSSTLDPCAPTQLTARVIPYLAATNKRLMMNKKSSSSLNGNSSHGSVASTHYSDSCNKPWKALSMDNSKRTTEYTSIICDYDDERSIYSDEIDQKSSDDDDIDRVIKYYSVHTR